MSTDTNTTLNASESSESQSKFFTRILRTIRANRSLTVEDQKRLYAYVPASVYMKPKRVSRADRWSKAAANAVAALEELREVQEEFENWSENLSDNLREGPTGEKLSAICDLDIETALSTAQEAEAAEAPRGWGRD